MQETLKGPVCKPLLHANLGAPEALLTPFTSSAKNIARLQPNDMLISGLKFFQQGWAQTADNIGSVTGDFTA